MNEVERENRIVELQDEIAELKKELKSAQQSNDRMHRLVHDLTDSNRRLQEGIISQSLAMSAVMNTAPVGCGDA